MNEKRGIYGEILMDSVAPRTQRIVENLVKGAATAQKVDEHGTWEFGADFDSKGRGEALNWDLYAVGRDMHNRKALVIIQIRQWTKTRRNGFPNIKKSYFLLGRNEDDTVFAHPVSAHVVRRAINDGRNPIHATQRWIFKSAYKNVIRQGDLALVPMKRAPNGSSQDLKPTQILQDSHILLADKVREENGRMYALNPTLTHSPGTHPQVSGPGWHKVLIGLRADFYTFAAPTAD